MFPGAGSVSHPKHSSHQLPEKIRKLNYQLRRKMTMSRQTSTSKDMILIAMPWLVLNRTPIQLGILQPVVENAGFTVGTRSFFLSAMELFAAGTANLPPSERITVNDYQEIVYRHYDVALGDWIFVVPPYHQSTSAEDEKYVAYLRHRKVSEE